MNTYVNVEYGDRSPEEIELFKAFLRKLDEDQREDQKDKIVEYLSKNKWHYELRSR